MFSAYVPLHGRYNPHLSCPGMGISLRVHSRRHGSLAVVLPQSGWCRYCQRGCSFFIVERSNRGRQAQRISLPRRVVTRGYERPPGADACIPSARGGGVYGAILTPVFLAQIAPCFAQRQVSSFCARQSFYIDREWATREYSRRTRKTKNAQFKIIGLLRRPARFSCVVTSYCSNPGRKAKRGSREWSGIFYNAMTKAGFGAAPIGIK